MSARSVANVSTLAPAAPAEPSGPPPSECRRAILEARAAALRAQRTAERARMWWLHPDEEAPLNSEGRMDTPLQ